MDKNTSLVYGHFGSVTTIWRKGERKEIENYSKKIANSAFTESAKVTK